MYASTAALFEPHISGNQKSCSDWLTAWGGQDQKEAEDEPGNSPSCLNYKVNIENQELGRRRVSQLMMNNIHKCKRKENTAV